MLQILPYLKPSHYVDDNLNILDSSMKTDKYVHQMMQLVKVNHN